MPQKPVTKKTTSSTKKTTSSTKNPKAKVKKVDRSFIDKEMNNYMIERTNKTKAYLEGKRKII